MYISILYLIMTYISYIYIGVPFFSVDVRNPQNYTNLNLSLIKYDLCTWKNLGSMELESNLIHWAGKPVKSVPFLGYR